METMVATVLIIVVFMMSSMVMNSLFTAQLKYGTRDIGEHMQKLEYFYLHDKISLPYVEDWENWEITIQAQSKKGISHIVFEAVNKDSQRSVSHYTLSNE